MCGGQQQANCAAECGENLDWACANCPRKRFEDLHAYTMKLLRTRMLKKAGYPFAANDLTYEEWLDLGRLETCLETSEPSLLKLLSTTRGR